MKVKQEIKYHLSVLGCQMNKSDAERIRSVLATMSFIETSDKKAANLLIYVACSVRQGAIDKIYSHSGQWSQRRKAGQVKTILTGCLTSFDKTEIAKRFDLILDISDLPNWPSKIDKLFDIKSSDLTHKSYLSIKPEYISDFAAFVPIMNGCNNFCSYCVVPYTRGREVSRPVEEVLCEVNALVKKGYKEITLVGQNVNSYDGGVGFPELLKMINAIDGDFWVRFVTSHPKDMSDELIDAICESEKVCEYFHMAVQSGDDDILQDMNRRYTAKHFEQLVTKIRTKIHSARKGVFKNAMISTDFIVGFPGESEEQFQNTVELMEKLKFDMAYISRYSTRPGTAAEKLTDDVSAEEKQKREHTLLDILRKTALENNRDYLDEEVMILVEGKKKDQYFGKTRTFKNVSFSTEKNLIGQFVKVKITKAGIWGLQGEVIE